MKGFVYILYGVDWQIEGFNAVFFLFGLEEPKSCNKSSFWALIVRLDIVWNVVFTYCSISVCGKVSIEFVETFTLMTKEVTARRSTKGHCYLVICNISKCFFKEFRIKQIEEVLFR